MLKFLAKQGEAGVAQMFKISKLDNPKYVGMKDIIMAQLAGLSPEQKEAYLYGEMGEADDRVFALDSDRIGKELPKEYMKSWRHAVVVDPAIQSKAGYLLLAQEPGLNTWHIVAAEYITGMQDPVDLLDEVEKRVWGYDIVEKISDNQAWFTGTAKKRGHNFRTPPNKQKRDGKTYIIKKAQMFLSSGGVNIPKRHEDLWYELESYRWDETGKHIVNSNKYHIIDCLVYFIDCLPKNEVEAMQSTTYDDRIRSLNRRMAGKNVREQQKILKNVPSVVKLIKGNAAGAHLRKLGIKTWR